MDGQNRNDARPWRRLWHAYILDDCLFLSEVAGLRGWADEREATQAITQALAVAGLDGRADKCDVTSGHGAGPGMCMSMIAFYL